MEKEVLRLLEKTKIQLVLNEPFFASLALRFEYHVRKDLNPPTACTNGVEICIHPDFYKSLNLEQQKGLLAHEVMHVAMMHHLRVQGRDTKLWNVACDYAINPILIESGFTLPDGGLNDRRFHDMSAEDIYEIIKEEPQDESGNDAGGFGEIEQVPDNVDVKEMEQEITQMVLQSYNLAKEAGKEPGNLSELIKSLLEPQKNWREVLIRFISETARNDYTWTKPSTRYMAMGLYLPKLESQEVGKVMFAIDTSGSIDEELLKEFAAELKDAANMFQFPVTIIHCDTKVRKVEEMDDESEIRPQGRGGTEFQPVFDYIDEETDDAKAVVYFTDGQSYLDNLKEPYCPVIWAVYDNKHFNPPFGEVVHLNTR